jgi:hypothetical protein
MEGQRVLFRMVYFVYPKFVLPLSCHSVFPPFYFRTFFSHFLLPHILSLILTPSILTISICYNQNQRGQGWTRYALRLG